MDIIFLQKCIDSLQEAFIHPLEPCEARFNMDAYALFDYIELERTRTILNITSIGFIWRKKVIYI